MQTPPLRLFISHSIQELVHVLGLAASKSTGAATQKATLTPHKTKEQWLNECDSHSVCRQYEQAIADGKRKVQIEPMV